jgi:dephospho-CoA kinase
VLRIGLTGGIGAGKSAVAARLRELGAVIIDSDQLAREVVALGTPGLAAVVERFGAGMLGPDGALDRPRLGAHVFGDPAELAALNAIVHPLVGERSAALLAAAAPDAILVHDIPLLVENGLAPAFDLVLVVEAPIGVRLERLERTRGMARSEASARMAAQATDGERRAAAGVVLVNDRGLAELQAEVDRLWRERLVPLSAAPRG